MRTPAETLPGTPGEALLKLFMQPLGLTAYRVATDLEVPPIAISEILRGLRSISPVMALKLGTYFGVEAHFWLALQSAHELKLAAAAVQAVMEQSENPPPPLKRCAALGDQAFAVRESVDGTGHRRWEVMLVNRPKGAPKDKKEPQRAPRTQRERKNGE
jgi:addiction module HigA family antidote